MSEDSTRSYWVGDELFWRINGHHVSDHNLRRFIFENNNGYSRYVGDCILARHTKQYAERNGDGR